MTARIHYTKAPGLLDAMLTLQKYLGQTGL